MSNNIPDVNTVCGDLNSDNFNHFDPRANYSTPSTSFIQIRDKTKKRMLSAFSAPLVACESFKLDFSVPSKLAIHENIQKL